MILRRAGLAVDNAAGFSANRSRVHFLSVILPERMVLFRKLF